MTRQARRALLAASIIGFFMMPIGFAQKKTIEEIIAKVNNEIILKSDYENAIKELQAELTQQGLKGPQLDQAVQERSKTLLSDLIDQSLLLQQAKDMGISAELEVAKQMEQYRQQNKLDSTEALEKEIVRQGMSVDDFKQNIRSHYLVGEVLQREVYPKIVITQDEMQKYYDTHKEDFDRPEGVRISEITIFTENRGPDELESQQKKAQETLAAVKKGDEFGQVAQKYSESDTAQNGGDLGFFQKGQLTPELEEVISKLDRGQASDLIKTRYGLMIVKVDDRHSGGILNFENAQNEIQRILWNQRVPGKVREYLNRMRTEGFVEIVGEGYVDTAAPAKPKSISEAKTSKE
jgi:peptidyl-prolyl cis-trans isomerase SurA